MKFKRRDDPKEFVSVAAVLKSKFKPIYFLKGTIPNTPPELLKITEDKVIYTNTSFLVEVNIDVFYGCPPAGVYRISGIAKSADGWDTVLSSMDTRYPDHNRIFPKIPAENMIHVNLRGVYGVPGFLWKLSTYLGEAAQKIGGYNQHYIEAMEAWLSMTEIGVDVITCPMLVIGVRGRGCIMPMTAE